MKSYNKIKNGKTSLRKKILFIEDDEFLQNVYQYEFGNKNITVIMASDGEDGLKKAEKERPDLILLDLILPKMDGFSVLEEIKKDPELKNIPVIVLSNLGQKKDVQTCKKMGAVDYIVKMNSRFSEVVEKINQNLS